MSFFKETHLIFSFAQAFESEPESFTRCWVAGLLSCWAAELLGDQATLGLGVCSLLEVQLKSELSQESNPEIHASLPSFYSPGYR